MSEADLISARLAQVRQNILQLAGDREVEIVVVTKSIGDELVSELVSAGLDLFGENHAPVLERRQKAHPDCSWDFLGHLSRKVADLVVGRCRRVVSVRSRRDLRYVSRAAVASNITQQVLLQIELTGLPGRRGFDLEGVREVLSRNEPGVVVEGLMTMAGPDDHGQVFERAQDLSAFLIGEGNDLPVLSMGMSQDYEAAVRAGSTEVRLGRILLGETPSTN